MRTLLRFLACGMFLVHTSLAVAQSLPEEVDPNIPTPAAFLGYGMGEYHTTYGPMVDYLRELARASERLRLGTFGASFEKRPLYLATISSPGNLARLDTIRENLTRLARPDESSEPNEAVFRDTPAVVFLNYGNDGNETAAFEAAIWMAYELVARRDEAVETLLDELVVLIVPAMNPDSHERYVAWYNAAQVGAGGTADPNAAEHWPPWGMSTNNNHYQINLNRDSVWATQPETRAMVALYRQWNPQVFVDHHGETDAYTGPWMVEPLHEVLSARQREWLTRFGRHMAERFAEAGYRYTPWEFGQFDPGYWDTLPNFTGSIGFTLETTGGGYRGILYETPASLRYTLRDGIAQHLIADRALLDLAARSREELLRDFHAYKKSAIAEGRTHATRAFLIPPDNDPSRVETVIHTLLRHDIEVSRATEPLRATALEPYPNAPSRTELPAGTFVIPMAQPESRLLRVLMEPEAKMSEDFLGYVKAHRERRARPGFLHPDIWTTQDAFYDITAWSLPLTYDLEAYHASSLPVVATESLDDTFALRGSLTNPEARHAFLFDYASNDALEAIAALKRQGLTFRAATEPFEVAGRRFGRGAIAVFRDGNADADIERVLAEVVERTALEIVGVDGPLVDKGPHLGSDTFVAIEPTRIAVLMDSPVRTSSYGSIWYLFERVYGVSFAAINVSRIPSTDLRAYDVIVMPDGDFLGLAGAESEALEKSLTGWVQQGGTLVTLREASAWATRESSELTRVRMRGGRSKSSFMTEGGRPSDEPAPAAESTPAETLPGTILRAEVHPLHYLSFGYEGEVPVMVWSNLAFEPDETAAAPIRFVEEDRLKMSGFAFDDSLERLAGTPYVVEDRVGKGHVILFLDDPNFRLSWDGLTRLFFNAIFFSKSF